MLRSLLIPLSSLRMVRSQTRLAWVTSIHLHRKIWTMGLLPHCGSKRPNISIIWVIQINSFADRNASEWVSFTLTTKDHLLLNEITRITTQLPGNALNSFLSTEPITPLGHEDVNMSIVVHHQPHFTTQKPNETVLWGYFLYPRRRGEFVDKQYIKMTGKEMLQN